MQSNPINADTEGAVEIQGCHGQGKVRENR